MFAKVVAYSVPAINGAIVSKSYQETSENLGGLFANVCYSSGYDIDSIDSKIKDVDSNHARFDRVAGTGHHSISDHTNISVYLGGISKITAMVLNSLGLYATSERSGRYTDMSKGADEDEFNLYNKWKDLFFGRIQEVYPDIDSNRRTKLAQENARYMIDVCSPFTSMVYTTTYRQWSYIVQWLDKFLNLPESNETFFRVALSQDFKYIRDFIVSSKIGNPDKILDLKNRTIDFLAFQMNVPFPDEQQFGYSYTVLYNCSFAALAHLHRHRTIKYMMNFNDLDKNNFRFYIPEILKKDRSLVDKWIRDMQHQVARGCIPNGTLVPVAEMGTVPNFILKCEERLCGRVLLETALNTKATLEKLYQYTNPSSIAHTLLNDMYTAEHRRCKAKCELLNICNEPCEFKAPGAVNRSI